MTENMTDISDGVGGENVLRSENEILEPPVTREVVRCAWNINIYGKKDSIAERL